MKEKIQAIIDHINSVESASGGKIISQKPVLIQDFIYAVFLKLALSNVDFVTLGGLRTILFLWNKVGIDKSLQQILMEADWRLYCEEHQHVMTGAVCPMIHKWTTMPKRHDPVAPADEDQKNLLSFIISMNLLS